MTVDAHQHFIRYRREDYPWIGAEMTPLRRDYLPEELAALAAAAGVDATVAVEARQSLEETDWLLALARSSPLIAGVVGWVDLCSPDIEQTLERYAGEPLLKGVRHVLHDEPDDDFVLRDDFLRGIGKLARFGLTYDILIFPRHLPQTLELVRRYPDQPFVIDHLAKPAIRDGEIRLWRSGLEAVAAFPNVSCKLSGMVTEARPGHWSTQDFRPYIDTVLELFGPERTMVGSDWPVCTLRADYPSVLAIVRDATAELSAADRSAIFGGTAADFYRLSPRQEAPAAGARSARR